MNLTRRVARLEIQAQASSAGTLSYSETMRRITEILQRGADRRAQALGIEPEPLTSAQVDEFLRSIVQ